MRTENQIAAVSAHYASQIARVKSALAVAKRAMDTLNGRTVRVIEVDKATAQIRETIRGASTFELNRAALNVDRYEAEIAKLEEARDLSIMSIEIAAEDKGRREAARRARDAFAVACIEDGIEDYTAEVG